MAHSVIDGVHHMFCVMVFVEDAQT